MLEADGVPHLLQELLGAGFLAFFRDLTKAREGVMLFGKRVRRAIFKPDAFRILPHLCFRIKTHTVTLCGEFSA